MRNALCISVAVLLAVQGCAGPMAVRHATKKTLIVPRVCDLDMTVHDNIAPCVRALLPAGERYGLVALDRLDAVEDRVPNDKISQANETRAIIRQSCLETGPQVRALYEAGRADEASGTGGEALMRCFFYATRVLENFAAGKQGRRLSNAASRAYWGLYLDDDFLMPPPDLYLGAL